MIALLINVELKIRLNIPIHEAIRQSLTYLFIKIINDLNDKPIVIFDMAHLLRTNMNH